MVSDNLPFFIDREAGLWRLHTQMFSAANFWPVGCIKIAKIFYITLLFWYLLGLYCLRGVIKKKLGKSGQADRLGDPPYPEAVRKMKKNLDKLSYLGLFCHFIKDENGSNFFYK